MFAKTDWVDGDNVDADAMNALGQAINDPRVALTIVEFQSGGWSGDAPPGRSNGANPITFIPYDPDNPTDPADNTNGIATPTNIREWDVVAGVTVESI